MLKFETIKNQLSFGTLKNAVFGAYDANDRTEKELLSLTELDVLEHLKDDEIDFSELVNEYNDWELEESNIDLDNFYYNDEEFENISIEIEKQDNSYNWNSSAVFNYDFIKINDIEYVAIKFHRFGDVRGNYTDYMLLNLQHHEFLEKLMELNTYTHVEINNINIELSYNIFNESCCYDVWSDDLGIYEQNVYIDLDNTSIEIIKKGLKKYLIDNDYLEK